MMKPILLAMLLALGASPVRATGPAAHAAKDSYLCQTMLVRLPTAGAKMLASSAVGQWSQALAQVASGKATLIASPSVVITNDTLASSKGKNASLQAALSTKGSDHDKLGISFESADLKFTSAVTMNSNLGRGQIVSEVGAPNDPGKSVVLLMRVQPLASSEKAL